MAEGRGGGGGEREGGRANRLVFLLESSHIDIAHRPRPPPSSDTCGTFGPTLLIGSHKWPFLDLSLPPAWAFRRSARLSLID